MHQSSIYLKLLSTLLFLVALTLISILAFLPNYNALPSFVSLSDVLNHSAAFFLLMCLLHFSISTASKTTQMLYLLFYALYIEAIQHFLPNRYADVYDVLADAAGVVVALFCIKLSQNYILLRNRNSEEI